MNTLIRKLGIDAGVFDEVEGYHLITYFSSTIGPDNVEKFTELVVRKVISLYNNDGFETPYEQDQLVLQQFGIENEK